MWAFTTVGDPPSDARLGGAGRPVGRKPSSAGDRPTGDLGNGVSRRQHRAVIALTEVIAASPNGGYGTVMRARLTGLALDEYTGRQIVCTVAKTADGPLIVNPPDLAP